MTLREVLEKNIIKWYAIEDSLCITQQTLNYSVLGTVPGTCDTLMNKISDDTRVMGLIVLGCGQ